MNNAVKTRPNQAIVYLRIGQHLRLALLLLLERLQNHLSLFPRTFMFFYNSVLPSLPWHLLRVSQMCSFTSRHLIMAWFYSGKHFLSVIRGGWKRQTWEGEKNFTGVRAVKRKNTHPLIVEYISLSLEERTSLPRFFALFQIWLEWDEASDQWG